MGEGVSRALHVGQHRLGRLAVAGGRRALAVTRDASLSQRGDDDLRARAHAPRDAERRVEQLSVLQPAYLPINFFTSSYTVWPL